MNFWPDDINSDEVRSPLLIMRDAGAELESRTSRLTVRIGETVLEDRVVLAFQVHNRQANFTLTLFEASHRLDHSFPVVIDPPSSDIPEFLRTERYVPGTPSILTTTAAFSAAQMLAEIQGTPGRYVKNEWVCATPSEFKEKLTNLFSRDHVKSRIMSLLAPATSSLLSDADAEEGPTSGNEAAEAE